MTEKEVVIAYWQAMASNDFVLASECLADEFECAWPQSGELIVGRANFAQINAQYPSQGRWQFNVNQIVQEKSTVVSDVCVSDGVRHDRVITFHVIEKGLIVRQTEFWPESFQAPAWRSAWVEKL